MWINIRSAPILAIAGTLTMNVISVFLNALFPLKNKKSRTILNDLIIVV